ncbi:MAG: 4Fe-4S binding protein [Anaerolineae bacterium]|jgi:Na+-translocating ferredoxin:NAD+ oxidoreductase RNF subunit RnfB|nr:4Fe-4S binding protein [Anaerolineae bacterium]
MSENVYRQLADALNSLPEGFPAAPDDSHLRLLEYLFTPEEALLAAQLTADIEPMKPLLERLGGDLQETGGMLKDMAKHGLIRFGRTEAGSGFGLEPFVVGIYENQVNRIDGELAALFEAYFRHGFGEILKREPQVHRIIPVQESIQSTTEVRPYESLIEIVQKAKSIGVQECICRKQKDLIGEGCGHLREVCMVLAPVEGAFIDSKEFRDLTTEEALELLKACAEDGLVHSVSNTQENYYICNCCSCCCGILRGMKDLGIANVVARSAFVNTVDEAECIACGACVEACPFEALTLEDTAVVNTVRCTGCGVCIPTCPTGALSLVRRPEEEIKPVPENRAVWADERRSTQNQA